MRNVVPEHSSDMAANLCTDHRRRIKHSLGAAESYAHRKPRKHDAEMALIRRGMALAAGVRTVLDAPCGVGRATILLARMGYKKTDLKTEIGLSSTTIAKLSKGESVTTDTILRICERFDVQPGDIMEYVPDEDQS